MEIKMRLTFACVCCFLELALLPFAPVNAQEGAVKIEQEYGFISVHFPLLRSKTIQYPDKIEGLILEFGGQLNGKTVGTFAQILMDWEEQKSKDAGFSFWWSAARLESAGVRSNVFVNELASIYGLKMSSLRAKPISSFKVVSVAKKPSSSASEIKLKAFIDVDGGENYAEFFFNIDLKRKIVSISEKDPEYRKAMIRAFAE
jgi:hypothetical protein